MDSAMRPREIQTRIRAGESLEEVARLSGEPFDRIERFAAPVLAEREHVAHLALTSSVRRRGELASHRTLHAVVDDQLTAHGLDIEDVRWDAWRNKDKRWTVQAQWGDAPDERMALFQFDLVGRFSVAADADASWLIAEDDDNSSPDDTDELALVRVLGAHSGQRGAGVTSISPDDEPTISLPEEDPRPEEDWLPRSAATPQEIREELEAEIDAYGVIPEGRSELDVLYDMLGGIAEDSINIYAGLSEPVLSEPEAQPQPTPVTPPSPIIHLSPELRGSPPTAESPPAPTQDPGPVPAEAAAEDHRSHPEPTIVTLPDQDASEQVPPAQSQLDQSRPDQSRPVVDDEPTVQVAPGAAKRRGARRKRASVPSWDEIMFGGPPKKD